MNGLKKAPPALRAVGQKSASGIEKSARADSGEGAHKGAPPQLRFSKRVSGSEFPGRSVLGFVACAPLALGRQRLVKRVLEAPAPVSGTNARERGWCDVPQPAQTGFSTPDVDFSLTSLHDSSTCESGLKSSLDASAIANNPGFSGVHRTFGISWQKIERTYRSPEGEVTRPTSFRTASTAPVLPAYRQPEGKKRGIPSW